MKVPEFKCCVCKKALEPFDGKEELENYENLSDCQKVLMFNGGMIGTIYAGYGSSHDTKAIVIGVCDECMDMLIEEQLTFVSHDYTGFFGDVDL